ncbi:TonB-dependent receptor [uncultured Spongiibacter sp.]|uniref:TonB-dependent receptor n=1 Tax=uncultured Spongiibacter sp. TaxID=870896 RepID=UPI00258F6BB4|nr:TonB-dependent receptor [uncultured Spongiibacter sp.]
MKSAFIRPLLCMVGIASAGVVQAQSRVLEEVIITAQKTEQSLQDVPISVTAVDGEFMQDAAIGDLQELSVFVPNVRMDDNDPGSPQIFIRGFGTNTFNPSFESSVGLVQDELFMGRAGYFTEGMFDVGRVEVLRGPQGTLFGKNTVSGVFNVFSRPVTEAFSANAELRAGEFGEQRVEVGAGGMVNDWFGLRFAAVDTQRDGQLHNQFSGRDQEASEQDAQRLKLLFVPSDAMEIELIALESQTEMAYWPKQLKALDADTRDYLADFDANIEDDPEDFTTSMNRDGELEKGSTTYSAKLSYSFGEVGALRDLNMVAVLGRSDFFVEQDQDMDVSPADLLTLFNREDYRQDTLEWRFTGNAESLFGLGNDLQFVAGLFYFESDYELNAKLQLGDDIGSWLGTDDAQQMAGSDAILLPALRLLAQTTTDDHFRFHYLQNTESLALFGQFSLSLGDNWVVTPGLRFNREDKRIDSLGESACSSTTMLPALACVTPLLLDTQDYNKRGLERNERDVSPKLSVMYYLSEETNVFATVSRGFKSGGFNAISFTGEDIEFDDENATTAELGIKGRFFDRSLSVNATLYRTEFEDLQVLAFNGVFFDVSNAATATSQGLEVDWQWLTPWEPLSMSGSLGLLDARYDEYQGAPAPVTDGIDQRQDLSGERIAFAPEVSATLSPSLHFTLGDAFSVNIAADIIHQGEQYTDVDLDDNTRVPANTKLNLRLSLASADEWWSATVGVKNASDERTQNQVIDSVLFPGTYYAQQNPGRQVYGSLRFNW